MRNGIYLSSDKRYGQEEGREAMLFRLSSEGYAQEEGRKATGNLLLLFPVSRLRIPKTSDFR